MRSLMNVPHKAGLPAILACLAMVGQATAQTSQSPQNKQQTPWKLAVVFHQVKAAESVLAL